MEQQQPLLKFKLDLSLLNVIRNFKHKNHIPEGNFIEQITALIDNYDQNPQKASFEQYIGQIESKVQVSKHYSERTTVIGMKEIILTTHFRFASIANLQDLIAKLGSKQQLEVPIKKEVSHTNVRNIFTVFDLWGGLDKQTLETVKKDVKSNPLNELTIAITDKEDLDFDTKTNTVFLCYEILALGIKSKGKLEINMSSYVAFKLNSKLNLSLYHNLFSFAFEKDPKLVNIYTENYSKNMLSMVDQFKSLAFSKDTYKIYREKLVTFKPNEKYDEKVLVKLLNDIENQVNIFIIARSHRVQHFLEKLLIGMLGHPIEQVRDRAIILLNVVYDGVDWQRRAPFHCKISTVGSKFKIHYMIESDHDDDIVLLLKSYIFVPQCKQNIISIHKPLVREFRVVKGRRFAEVILDLGKFTRCGFYDWKLVRLEKSGIKSIYKIADLNSESIDEGGEEEVKSIEIVTKPVQGRFIVHPSYSKELQIHEIFVDQQDGVIDESGKILKRGNFKKVSDAMEQYKKTGINCLYLMGALERDNGLFLDKISHQPNFKRPETSPLAVTSRNTPNSMLGGKVAFQNLTKKAKEIQMQIMLDVLTRVSSARMHQKYRTHILHTLDQYGKKIAVFGSDGRAIHFEDTALLNYRKKKCWDLFLNEIMDVVSQYGITGVHLDNGQAWPQILQLDIEEMYRKETDGLPAYTNKQIFEGEVVYIDENCGFWGSKLSDALPNPFLVKLCRRLWMNNPEFLIVSEVWGSYGGYEAREYSVIQSGPIPRLFKLPVAISQFFGNELKKDGTINQIQRRPVNAFKKWYETSSNALPEGSILVQSTTYHTWPYPGMLYKKGAWAAADLVFFLQDIPMTFIGEIEGKATKVKATNFFAALKVSSDIIKEESDEESGDEEKQEDEQKQEIVQYVKKLASHKVKAKKLMLLEADTKFFEKESLDQVGFGFNLYDSQQYQEQGSGGLNKRRSSGFLQLTQKTGISQDEKAVVATEGWDFLEALKGIYKHYEHRRQLRIKYKPLKKGKFISLLAEHLFGWHTHVLSFARYTKKQMAIIAINFNDGPVDGFLNLKGLGPLFPEFENSDVVFEIEDWMSPEKNTGINNHYFVGEFLLDKMPFHLERFQTIMYGVNIHINKPEKIKRASQDSLARLVEQINSQKPQEIFRNDCAHYLYFLVNNSKSLKDFINGFGWAYEQYYKDIDLNQLISLYKPFKEDYAAKNRLFAYFNLILKEKEFENSFPFFKVINNLVTGNKLGPVVMATPEYGKWTKTGGLGVMTDELARGLAELGQTVYTITPWYEIKNKAKPKMLEEDGIKYQRNLEIWVGPEKKIVGLHYGYVLGHHLYFLHNPELFYEPFGGDDPAYIMKGLVLYAKCVLQVLCDLQVKPELIITNDWFSGLIQAYIRNKKFGNYFDQTKTYHIAHNLDPTYEGRLWPTPQQGNLSWIHELPDVWLIDPYWKDFVINPSRCAFMNCDNWGTVSHSYKFQLLRESPLSPILSWFPNAFSFCNGLNKAERLADIEKKTGNDHIKAKEYIQKKYFGMTEFDNTIPLFGFVGRLTEQKGVHLMVDAAEELIHKTKGKIQMLIGGNCSMKEAYAKMCADKIYYLKNKYPKNFWGDPTLFFSDGPFINVGSDYGMMPSKFEPGGIVQHEFFVGSTPVVAMKTGGLQDTVHEFNLKTFKGSGHIFEQHNKEQFVAAMERALNVFNNHPEAYQKLRTNSFNAVIDVSEVSRAYAIEFYRMFNKNFIDIPLMKKQMTEVDSKFDIKDFAPQQTLLKKKGLCMTKEMYNQKGFEKVLKETEASEVKAIVFKYKPKKGQILRSVALIGTFDNWKRKNPLKYDPYSREWKVTLGLTTGEYYYKYVVDDEWICNDDDPKDTDLYGNLNNIVRV